MGFKIVSMIDTKEPLPNTIADIHHLEVIDDLNSCHRHYPINNRLIDSDPTFDIRTRPYVVLALEAEEYIVNQPLVDEFLINRRNLSIFPPLPGGVPIIGTEIDPIYRHEALHLRVRTNLANWRLRILKRAFDLIGSLAGLAILSPLFVVIYLKIRYDDGGPVFYGQKRVGSGGRIFTCWKFRSMRVNAEDVLSEHLENNPILAKEYRDTQKLKNDPRITPFGKFIRKYSIDELPQLFNVLTGSMSLVGPRPVRLDELHSMYGESAKYYLMSAPGITGLWQTSGRSTLKYDTRVNLDTWYVRNWTLWGDFKIILDTTSVVLSGQDAY